MHRKTGWHKTIKRIIPGTQKNKYFKNANLLSSRDGLQPQLRLQNIKGQLIVLDYVLGLQAVPVQKVRPVPETKIINRYTEQTPEYQRPADCSGLCRGDPGCPISQSESARQKESVADPDPSNSGRCRSESCHLVDRDPLLSTFFFLSKIFYITVV